ncbi:MAG: two-component system regulatory protein YycI [Alkalibacterium sp.]|nr:two-component system regulatory protein YycI [Alkalibacterium sp.]
MFYGRDGNIISYQQTYAGPMTPQGSTQSIITDRQAIEILFQNNEISSNSTVSQPILSYYRTLHLEDLSMYGPVWFVPVRDSSGETDICRVDALERTIISEPAAPLVPEEPEEPEDAEEEPEEDLQEDNSDGDFEESGESDQSDETDE